MRQHFRLYGTVLVCLLFVCLLIESLPVKKEAAVIRPGKDHALLFAVDRYDDSEWAKLDNPVRDAKAIAEELENEYGFEVHLFENPDKQQILRTLLEWQQKSFAEDGQLFVFFSGHGAFSESFNSGYFVPKTGKADDPFHETHIQLTTLGNAVSRIPCPHILLAIDACYSGTIDQKIAFKGDPARFRRPGETDAGERQRLIDKQLSNRSRLLLTSGGKERTPDGAEHSPFSSGLLRALRETYSLGDGLLSYTLLLSFMETISPLPHYGELPGHKGGGFMFVGSKDIAGESSTLSQSVTGAPASSEKLYELDLIRKDHYHEVQCVNFSTNGDLLASSGKDDTIRLWDPDLGRVLQKLERDKGSGYGQCIDFAPNNRMLAAASWGGLYLWEQSGSEWRLKTILQKDTWLNVCAFSPDGRWLASGANSEKDQLLLWDAQNLTPKKVPHVESAITAIGFSADGQWLAVATDDFDERAKVYVWKVEENGSLTLQFEHDQDGSATDLAFHPKSNLLAVSYYEQMVELYDIQQREKVKTLTYNSEINSLEFHPDGTFLAMAGYSEIVLLSTSDYSIKQLIDGHAFFVTFNATGNKLAAGTGGGSYGCESRGGSCAVKVWRAPLERR